ncbi:MAG: hypothetical protein KGN16_10340 [Burkholderiales bacterium]|nr:hypothetical protein [Burkholderiales bacterium]
MGRPAKLTPREEDDILARLLRGEVAADLAREYGISKATMSERFAAVVRELQAIAAQLVQVENTLRALPPASQLAALRLAEDIRMQQGADRLLAQTLAPRFGQR